ncbi:MAG: heparan-alpha-glucosaminide N-acetyltransferase domain-containing protein [Acidobacteriota bacterium]
MRGTSAAVEPKPAAGRLASIDVLRGIVMILMAIDHTRDFFGHPGNPTDLATTTTGLFFTRWITHLCAPTFFLLTGLGAGLSRRHRSTGHLAMHLLRRGAWLLVLELVVVRCLGLQFNFDYRVTVVTVLWALGWSMIALAAVVRLSPRTVAILGSVMIVGHNLLDALPEKAAAMAAPSGGFPGFWSVLGTVLHSPGMAYSSERVTVFLAYPLIPWIGVAMVGYGLATVYDWTRERRQRVLAGVGATLALACVVLRAINLYGDPFRWSTQDSLSRTLLSFLDTTKYPPSLLFLLMTLGPALMLLAALDGRAPRALRPAYVFGQVPLFYYLLHLPVIHLLAVAVCFARLGDAHWMFESPNLGQFPFTQPPGWGFDLPWMYLAWAAVVLTMYPLCRWYAVYKRGHKSRWLSYL